MRTMRKTTARRLAAVAALCLIAVGAGIAGAVVGRDSQDDDAPVPEAGARQDVERRASFLAQLLPLAPEAAAKGGAKPRTLPEQVRALPLEDKVAQLMLVGFPGTDLNAAIYRRLQRFGYGGIVIDRGNYAGPDLLGQLAGEAGVIARRARHVPPWVMAPQEGGEFNAFADLPPATAASDLTSVRQARAEARAAAASLRERGLNGVLAPVADVGFADDPALGPRAFSDDPARVAAYTRAVTGAYRRGRVFAAAQHFPGLGSASQSTEDGPANVGLALEQLRERDLLPFRAAIRAGVPGIVVGNGLYTTDSFVTPAAQSKAVIEGLLRDELKFKGVAIADDITEPAVTALGNVADAAVESVKAGADMVYISRPPRDQQTAYIALLKAARAREIPRARLDEAVVRILTAKRRYGLLKK